MVEVHQEAALVRGELAEARQDTEVAKEAARAAEDATRAAEDATATAADNAQDIGLQAGFNVLRQALVQVVLGFDVDA